MAASRITSAQAVIAETVNIDAAKERRNLLTSIEPYKLEPKFSVTDRPAAFSNNDRAPALSRTHPSGFLTPTDQPPNPIQAVTQTITDTKNGWIAGAMRQGLDKYEAATSLATGASQIPGRTVR